MMGATHLPYYNHVSSVHVYGNTFCLISVSIHLVLDVIMLVQYMEIHVNAINVFLPTIYHVRVQDNMIYAS